MANVLYWLYDVLLDVYTKLSKVYFRFVTGKGEIERICSENFHNSEMSFRFAKSLKESKQLSTFTKIIFFPKPFPVKAAFDFIVARKRIPLISSSTSKPQLKILSMNINCCLVSLRHVNLVINNLEKSQKTIIVKSDTKYKALMSEFLSNMLGIDTEATLDPAYERKGGDVGFQNPLDSSTDFRAMGLLGLIQLVYFSQQDSAQR